MNCLPIQWIRKEKFCEISGITLKAVNKKIENGAGGRKNTIFGFQNAD